MLPCRQPLASCLLITLALAASPSSQQTARWKISSSEVGRIALPAATDVDALEFEYGDGMPIEGVSLDLNGDGNADFLVRAASSLCGATGNCPFAIVDGRSGQVLGQLGGSTIVLSSRSVNAYPVLETWWNTSAGSGEHSTYEFDGRLYQRVAREVLSGNRRERLLAEWRALPALATRR